MNVNLWEQEDNEDDYEEDKVYDYDDFVDTGGYLVKGWKPNKGWNGTDQHDKKQRPSKGYDVVGKDNLLRSKGIGSNASSPVSNNQDATTSTTQTNTIFQYQ